MENWPPPPLKRVYLIRLEEEEAQVVHEVVQDYLLEKKSIGKYTPALLSAEVELTRQLFDEQGLEPRNAKLVGEPYLVRHIFGEDEFRITVRDPGSACWIDVFVHIGKDGMGSVVDTRDDFGTSLVEYPFPVDEDWLILKCEKMWRKMSGLDKRIK